MLDWITTRRDRSPLDDSHYYLARSVQEQVAARRATSQAARKAHDELAMLYRFKAAMLSSGPESWCDALAGEDQRMAGSPAPS